MYIFIVILCITSSFALSLETNQQSNLEDFYSKSSGNSIISSIAGSVNDVFGVGGINGTNYSYDKTYEFTSTDEDFYLILQNYFDNETVSIMYRGDLNKDPTLYIQNVTLNEIGRYYFKFSPSYESEPARVFLEFGDSYVGTIEYIEQKPNGFSSLIGVLVTSFQDLIDINISLWRLAFYSIIFLVMTTLVIGIFVGGFMLLRYSKNINKEAER